jgi:hypothetical protein
MEGASVDINYVNFTRFLRLNELLISRHFHTIDKRDSTIFLILFFRRIIRIIEKIIETIVNATARPKL